jgi:hypothetical protein
VDGQRELELELGAPAVDDVAPALAHEFFDPVFDAAGAGFASGDGAEVLDVDRGMRGCGARQPEGERFGDRLRAGLLGLHAREELLRPCPALGADDGLHTLQSLELCGEVGDEVLVISRWLRSRGFGGRSPRRQSLNQICL